MKILFASGHLPSPYARQAGQRISYHLCEHLACRHTLQLLSFAAGGEDASGSPDTLRIFKAHAIIPVSAASRLLGMAAAPMLPLAVAVRNQARFRRALVGIQQSEHFDAVIFDHMAMWQYADEAGPAVLRVGIAHDVLSQLWTRRAENGPGLNFLTAMEARRLRDWERSATRKLDLVCALSGKDSRLLSEPGKAVPQYVLQPWFVQPSDATLLSAAREHNSLVFTGAFDRRENADAAAFAVNDILPRIAREVPQCTFHLAGSAAERLTRRTAHDPWVRIAGYVPDLPAFLCHMQIGLLPLRLGAGVKIKVLECMAAGLAVVTTPVGAEGIPGRSEEHFLLGRTAEELARHAISLLRNPSFREQMGRRAQRLIRDTYDFTKTVQGFEQAMEQALIQKKRERDPTLARHARNQPEPLPAVLCREKIPGS
jgi:glycosyltransferase involved in cell wall biosynthesis